METIECVAYLLGKDFVVLFAIVVAVIASAAVAWVRYAFNEFGFYLSVAIIFLLLCYLAVSSGSSMANTYADALIGGGVGRPAYYELEPKADVNPKFRTDFVKVTDDDRVVMLKETDEMVHLYILKSDDLAGTQSTEPRHGQSLGIQKRYLSHCLVVSGRAVPSG